MLKVLSVLFVASLVASQGIPDPRCPTTVVRPSIRLPHETDCARFYICQYGLKHLMPPCPKGLLYEAPTSSCVAESLAKCDHIITPPPTAPTAPTVSVSNPVVTVSSNPTVPSVTGTESTLAVSPTVPEKPKV